MANGYLLSVIEENTGVEKDTMIVASVNLNKITAAKDALDTILANNFRDDPVGAANAIKAKVLEKTGVAIELTIDPTADNVFARVETLPVI